VGGDAHILDREDRLVNKGVKETIYVKLEKPSLIRGGGLRYHLSRTYNAALTLFPRRFHNHSYEWFSDTNVTLTTRQVRTAALLLISWYSPPTGLELKKTFGWEVTCLLKSRKRSPVTLIFVCYANWLGHTKRQQSTVVLQFQSITRKKKPNYNINPTISPTCFSLRTSRAWFVFELV